MPPRLKLFLELLEAGSLPASRLRSAFGAYQTPVDAGLVRKDPSGAGEVFSVVNKVGFRAWILSEFPGAFGGLESCGPRSANIAMNRNSKKGKVGLDFFTIMARAYRVPPGLDAEGTAAMVNIMDATRLWGAASLFLGVAGMGRLTPDPMIPPGLRVMTTENPETFDHMVWVEEDADLFVFCGTGGRMRDDFIEWLSRQAQVSVSHYGDYDPVGLQEYLRLVKRLPGRVSLHTPDGLETRFKKFGNRAILEDEKNANAYLSLPRGIDPVLDRVLNLIAEHGPLEQESLLVTGLVL